MAYQFIRYEVDEGVAMLTLNRPDVLNSFNRTMAQEVQVALAHASTELSVRAVLVTGAGRAFCAGQDLADVLPEEGEPAPDLGQIVEASYNPIIRAIRHTEKPFVCAVNGVAAGAGANLALACDLVLASEKASFIQSFSQIGLIPDSGGTFFLPRLVGLPRATAMMLLGNKVRAQEALEIGMIYQVFSPETLLGEALTLARRLATQPTAGFGLIKRGLNASSSNTLDAHLDLEADLQSQAGQTDDYHEGVSAFLEKRKPIFKGR